MMLELVIVENDPSQADDLRELVGLSDYAHALNVTCISDPADAYARVTDQRRRIDILICALYPTDSEQAIPAGIGLVQLLPRGSNTQVIYVTGCAAYHSSVYRTEHAYFLMKPVALSELNTALRRCIQRIAERREEPLCLMASRVERVVMPREITYAESLRRTVVVHVGSECLTAYTKLSELENALPVWFVRCHKSYLVNLRSVVEYRSDRLMLATGDRIPVSQARRKEVRDVFRRFVRAV